MEQLERRAAGGAAAGLNVFELGWQAECEQSFAEWAAENIRLKDSPYGDRLLLNETPWLMAPLETLNDPEVEETNVASCAQGGKTVLMHAALIYALDRKPGPTMFVAQTLDAAKDQAKGKIIPMIESCPGLAAQLPQGKGRDNRSLRTIIFPNATLKIGPANEAFLRFHTIQWLFGDECSMWAPGKMEQARARTTRVWNRKLFFASTPLEAREDFDRAYREGHQARYKLATPCCGRLVYLTSRNIETLFEWDKALLPAVGPGVTQRAQSNGTEGTEGKDQAANTKCQEGEVDDEEEVEEGEAPSTEWDALRASVRLVCPGCGQRHEQTEGVYRRMIAGARYVARRPKASRRVRSFAFNVFCLPPNVFSWGKIVELWLKAKAEEVRGNLAPLREFVTLRLAECWDERKFLSYSLPNFEAYDPTSEWELEMFRALTVDCQEHLAEFHVVVRAWGRDGSSRLLEAATVYTEAEIKELQAKWQVKPHFVGLDAAYERYRVFDVCLRNGWTAMCGSDRTEWSHDLAGDGRRVNRPWRTTRGDPRNGIVVNGKTWCTVVDWSNPTIKDLLWNLKEGKGAPWHVCDLGPAMSEKYAKWLDSERKREGIDRFGRVVLHWKKIRQNHFWDCECMQVVFASLAKLFVFGEGTPGTRPSEGGGVGEKPRMDTKGHEGGATAG